MGIRFDIDQLIEPYKEGGSEHSPQERSISTIANKLIVSYRLPPSTVGAAIFKIFSEMAFNGLVFEGDGTFGSRGRQLFSCIKDHAVYATKEDNVDKVLQEIKKMSICLDVNCKKRAETFTVRNRRGKIKYFLFKARGWWDM